MAGRRQVIHANDVVNAKEDLSARLERPAPLVDEDGDAYWGPSVVCAATTWEDFERWLNVNEGRLKRWDFEPLNDGTDRGIVVIYSLPSKVHEDAAHSIANSVVEQIQKAGNDIGLIHTVIGGRVTCWTGDRGQEPDASLTYPCGSGRWRRSVGGCTQRPIPKRYHRSRLQKRKPAFASCQTPALDGP